MRVRLHPLRLPPRGGPCVCKSLKVFLVTGHCPCLAWPFLSPPNYILRNPFTSFLWLCLGAGDHTPVYSTLSSLPSSGRPHGSSRNSRPTTSRTILPSS